MVVVVGVVDASETPLLLYSFTLIGALNTLNTI